MLRTDREAGAPFYYVELKYGPAIVLMDIERRGARFVTTRANLDAGNYFTTLEAAQRFADLINQMLKDHSNGLGMLAE